MSDFQAGKLAILTNSLRWLTINNVIKKTLILEFTSIVQACLQSYCSPTHKLKSRSIGSNGIGFIKAL